MRVGLSSKSQRFCPKSLAFLLLTFGQVCIGMNLYVELGTALKNAGFELTDVDSVLVDAGNFKLALTRNQFLDSAVHNTYHEACDSRELHLFGMFGYAKFEQNKLMFPLQM